VTDVLIRGAGVASSCCAQLLQHPDIRLKIEESNRPAQPAIMLSETTQKLLRDVFADDHLFERLPRITTRIVLWGSDTEPLFLPHSAVLVSEQALLARIRPQVPETNTAADEPDWAILAAGPLRTTSVEHPFGSRVATASPVALQPGADSQACWIESCSRGWLFLLPDGEDGGWLLSVGDPAESLLSESSLIAKQMGEIVGPGKKFPSHPRIADPLCGLGWLACGTAALGFDPLCGDGAGHAVREAILASAVVLAAAAGGDVNALVEHYRARLLAGFAKHLQICQEFYGKGRRGEWWDREMDSVHQGLGWCSSQLAGLNGMGYRLNGFALEPVH
jgi:2-polyprenyl-6-methoxyphenol hydroxylase-like FAD-dependent oxidoreductase